MPDAVAAPTLTVDIKRCAESTVVVYCHGRLVAGTTQVLTAAVCELIAGKGATASKRIVLDLGDRSTRTAWAWARWCASTPRPSVPAATWS